MTLDLDHRLSTATSAIREAGEVALNFYRQRDSLAVQQKGLQDFVSEADQFCEDLLVTRLRSEFPDDLILGEERGLQGNAGATIWIIDPIDGTDNFLRGIPFWCISLGLIHNGISVLGLIYSPPSGELFKAQEGKGASLNGLRIHVSKTTDISRARLGVGFSYRRPVELHIRSLRALLDTHCEYSRLGSGALGMALTADGRLDGYWEAHINAWDVAAGLCIVREAGGWTNHFFDGDGLLKGNQILACTPALAGELAKLLNVDDLKPTAS